MINHYYLIFQESKMTTYLSLLVKQNEFSTFGLNVYEGCYSIKVVYIKLILIEMKQSNHRCYICKDQMMYM